MVTYAPAHFASTSSFFAAAATDRVSSSEHHTSSVDLDDSVGSSVASDVSELPYVGGGRDYHSMHYIPSSRDEESQRGMRVLVLGNILVAAQDEAKHFEVDEFRIDEVRIRQPMLEAQWVPRKFGGTWKPRARHAHSSVVRILSLAVGSLACRSYSLCVCLSLADRRPAVLLWRQERRDDRVLQRHFLL